MAFDRVTVGRVNELEGSLSNKIKTYTYTASSTVSNIVHNITYNPTNDDMSVFYNGILLEKSANYTENANNISIDLVGWTIGSGEIINFKLYKNVK